MKDAVARAEERISISNRMLIECEGKLQQYKLAVERHKASEEAARRQLNQQKEDLSQSQQQFVLGRNDQNLEARHHGARQSIGTYLYAAFFIAKRPIDDDYDFYLWH